MDCAEHLHFVAPFFPSNKVFSLLGRKREVLLPVHYAVTSAKLRAAGFISWMLPLLNRFTPQFAPCLS